MTAGSPRLRAGQKTRYGATRDSDQQLALRGPISNQSISVNAPTDLCFRTASNFDKYLEWGTHCRVNLSRCESTSYGAGNSQGLASRVKFTTGTAGLCMSNILAYQTEQAKQSNSAPTLGTRFEELTND